MNINLRKKLQQRKRRLMSRIDKSKIPSTPAIQTPSHELQLADRTQAISAGGLYLITQMIKTLDLRYHINSGVSIFKVYAPYDEADHVLNIALNLLAGGTCQDHFEIRRTDEAYLNALRAQRIPDPTTVGDFCRRFDEMKILMLMQAINKARLQVWKLQPEEFFERAIIEVCRAAGFKEIFLRGYADFALTTEFDRLDDEGVKFIFGYDPKPNLLDIAESPENDDWKPLRRRHS